MIIFSTKKIHGKEWSSYLGITDSIDHHNPQSAQFCCVKTNLNCSFSTSDRFRFVCCLFVGLVSTSSSLFGLSLFRGLPFWLILLRLDQFLFWSEILTFAMLKSLNSSNLCIRSFSFDSSFIFSFNFSFDNSVSSYFKNNIELQLYCWMKYYISI